MLPSIGTKEIAVAANDYGGTAAQDDSITHTALAAEGAANSNST